MRAKNINEQNKKFRKAIKIRKGFIYFELDLGKIIRRTSAKNNNVEFTQKAKFPLYIEMEDK